VQFDPRRVSLFTELVSSVAEEMGTTLERVAFSTNIKERRDFSCAVFDEKGRLVAQAAHIPVHLGAMEFLMLRWLREGPRLMPGQFGITNDPFFAGTHLPDISLLSVVERNGRVVGYVACRAHHADVGGEAPGSFSPVDDVRREGVVIRPQLLTGDATRELLARSRNREEREGDLEAQRAAVLVGARRLQELAAHLGDDLSRLVVEARAYAEARTRAALSELPRGEWAASDSLEDVPLPGEHVEIRVTLRFDGAGSAEFDFCGTAPQQPIGINATEAVTRSACAYVVRCLAGDVPTNAGCFAPMTVIAPEGSLVNATFPAPVVGGNTETSQRIVDVILQALAQALPHRIPACSQGTMNNVAIGGRDWAYYETLGGGCGAGPEGPGASGWHSHMTNTANTPAEVLEVELPLRVLRYELRDGSGGAGMHRGGEGVVRELEFLDDVGEVSILSDRRGKGAPGARGGAFGAPGKNSIVRAGGRVELLGSKCHAALRRGDKLVVETPGGGGWGVQSNVSRR
jgi:N-methylhydantoinase B